MDRKQEKLTMIAICKKLGAIIRSHKAGSPIMREIAERIRAKETLKDPGTIADR